MSEQAKISRRRFLQLAGGVIGVGALTCGGVGLWATHKPKIDFPESDCGTGEKVLVAYASRAGSTGEVGEAIAERVCAAGYAAELRLVQDVTDVAAYRAVVLGSAIRMGAWVPEAVTFVETHQAALRQMPVAYFLTCMTLEKDTEENRREVAAYLDPVRAIVEPVSEGLFAGVLDYKKLPPLYQMIMKSMESPEGDFRDWEAIRAWADEVAAGL